MLGFMELIVGTALLACREHLFLPSTASWVFVPSLLVLMSTPPQVAFLAGTYPPVVHSGCAVSTFHSLHTFIMAGSSSTSGKRVGFSCLFWKETYGCIHEAGSKPFTGVLIILTKWCSGPTHWILVMMAGWRWPDMYPGFDTVIDGQVSLFVQFRAS